MVWSILNKVTAMQKAGFPAAGYKSQAVDHKKGPDLRQGLLLFSWQQT